MKQPAIHATTKLNHPILSIIQGEKKRKGRSMNRRIKQNKPYQHRHAHSILSADQKYTSDKTMMSPITTFRI
jgi:tRNA(Arg) A34 adenosine deaminase TadA